MNPTKNSAIAEVPVVRDPDITVAGPGPARDPGISRRGFLRPLSALAGAAAALRETTARATTAPPMVAADIDPGAAVQRLLRRTNYHPSVADLTEASNRGFSGTLEWQMNPSSIDDSVCQARLAAYPTLARTQAEMYTLQPPNSQELPNRPSILVALSELTEATITRAIFSRRQLHERMVEFWTDHFNIDILDQDQVFLKPIHDRDVIRANALGSFADLLVANAQSPAMLHYLDNIASTKKAPNENYARELMELHTITPEAGYSQTDVHEVARCFTGWGHYSESPSNGPLAGTFRFDSTVHDTGAKQVMGMDVPAGGGMSDGLAVLQMLATHPNTAINVCTKLCRFLLGEGTHQSIIGAAANAFLNTGGDIKSVLRVILTPSNLYDAPLRYKRPFHYYVSALRATSATITGLSDSRPYIDLMGQPMFAWTPPDGYPDTLSYWGRLLQPRWQFAIFLASVANNYHGAFAGAVIDDTAMFLGCAEAPDYVERVNQLLFLGEMSMESRQALELMLSPLNRDMRREMIGMALASDGFQWY